MEKNKREIWLDYIKALAIFLVLVLHTIRFGINDNSFSIGLIFYYFGTIAIPLFFMVNGYLQLRREITYKYVFKKIFKILFVALSWNFLFAFLNLVLYGGIENFFYNTFFSFLQHGYLYQFWFLGSLIIIYLILI